MRMVILCKVERLGKNGKLLPPIAHTVPRLSYLAASSRALEYFNDGRRDGVVLHALLPQSRLARGA